MTTATNIIIVGAGHMGRAIARGLKQSSPSMAIIVVESNPDRRAEMISAGITAEEEMPTPLVSQLIILSIPPQAFPSFSEANPHIKQYTGMIVSVMAGISLSELKDCLKTPQLSRAIPNLPCALNEGMTVLIFTPQTTKRNVNLVSDLFTKLGNLLIVDDEPLIDSATALVGGGPAYVSYFAAALIEYAISAGFDKTTAITITNTIFRGTSILLAANSEPPMRLCERVTTPEGTTQRAIHFFNEKQLRNIIVTGLEHACTRSKELGRRL